MNFAAGIYVREILENVPIDKHFELFKPQSGTEGGSIHIHAEYKLSDKPGVHGLLLISVQQQMATAYNAQTQQWKCVQRMGITTMAGLPQSHLAMSQTMLVRLAGILVHLLFFGCRQGPCAAILHHIAAIQTGLLPLQLDHPERPPLQQALLAHALLTQTLCMRARQRVSGMLSQTVVVLSAAFAGVNGRE